jgi:hypothetical protein
MHRNTKIATCCYCGTRATLVLDEGRHELVCSACGAPLHELKALPLRKTESRAHRTPSRPVPHRDREDRPRRGKPVRKPGKRKRILRGLVEEAFDLIEDILD